LQNKRDLSGDHGYCNPTVASCPSDGRKHKDDVIGFLKATILLRIDWLSGWNGALLWATWAAEGRLRSPVDLPRWGCIFAAAEGRRKIATVRNGQLYSLRGEPLDLFLVGAGVVGLDGNAVTGRI
jgi:hypothetical protein